MDKPSATQGAAAPPSTDPRTDAACMARLAAGEQAALRELFERHGRRVQALGLHLLRDAGEAEDLVQETFVEVWHRRAEYDAGRASVEGWVVLIARSRGLARLRARRSAQQRDAAAARERDEAVPPTAAQQVEAGQDRRRLAVALGALPPEQRRVVELAYFEGLTQVEISRSTQEPLGTVKTRARLALRRLAQLLAGGGAP